jgi:hypothetical protein
MLWSGATVRGYGVRKVGGRNGSVRYVHRMVCEAVHGPAKGRLALHRCNQPLCYNPQHLYWGTRKQNAADAVADGVQPHGMAKLSQDQVCMIRTNSLSSYQLAEQIGIAASTIRGIRNGHGNWKWLAR